MKQSQMAQRKDEHLNLALAQQVTKPSDFDKMRFVHHSFSLLASEEIELATQWAGKQHAFPFYINAMTGGSEKSKHYNEQLSILARETNLALASGSVSAAIKDLSVKETYEIMRQVNPDGFILANLGAHHSLESAQRAVELLDADALQIHLNVPQEVVMPEGDRDFRNWLQNIEQIVRYLDKPVIVKEVGFGMSYQTMRQLVDIGVQTLDVSGRGGTNFIQIENERGNQYDYQTLYQHGQSTAESLLESLRMMSECDVLASGGIRQPVDIVKALALGAKSVGIAGGILALLHRQGLDATIAQIIKWQEQLAQIYLMLGAKSTLELQKTDIILTGTLREWAQDRQIDYQQLARRR